MHLSSSILFGLLGSALAIPTVSKPDECGGVSGSHAVAIGKRQRAPNPITFDSADEDRDDCRDSSFDDQTSDKSAFTSGCREIAKWYRDHSGGYSISMTQGGGNKFLSLRISGDSDANCLFSVKHEAVKAYIGNTDIADIIDDAINKFSKKIDGHERIGASGTMGCLGEMVEDGEAAMHWRIEATKSPASPNQPE